MDIDSLHMVWIDHIWPKHQEWEEGHENHGQPLRPRPPAAAGHPPHDRAGSPHPHDPDRNAVVGRPDPAHVSRLFCLAGRQPSCGVGAANRRGRCRISGVRSNTSSRRHCWAACCGSATCCNGIRAASGPCWRTSTASAMRTRPTSACGRQGTSRSSTPGTSGRCSVATTNSCCRTVPTAHPSGCRTRSKSCRTTVPACRRGLPSRT